MMSAFLPKSGHRNSVVECPLCAKSRHSALRKETSLFFTDESAQQGKPAVERGPTPKRRLENQRFLQPEITKGLGRSRADRGLKFGECKGAAFAPSCNVNAFYEAFMTAI